MATAQHESELAGIVRPRLAEYLLSTIRGEHRGVLAGSVRLALAGLSLGYAGATAGVQCLYAAGVRARHRLPVPVVSVGGIALGGTGKTPLTRWTARRLAEERLRVGILLRGHGGTLVRQGGLVSLGDGPLLDARQAGDEAVMHAASLPGVAVAVGRDRVRMGHTLVRKAGCDVLVLDDGFQYWRLHRDLDLALVRADDPFDNGRPLPRGLLREPPSRLGRADLAFVTHAQRVTDEHLRGVVEQVRRLLRPNADVFTCRLVARHFVEATHGERIGLEELRGQPVFLLSAIADNEQFRRTAERIGLEVLGHRELPDHSEYDRHQLESASKEARRLGARALVTTEKDAAKLDAGRLELPAYVLHMELEIDRQEAFESRLLAAIGQGASGSTEA